MGGCTTSIESGNQDHTTQSNKVQSLAKIQAATLAKISDTDLVLRQKINEHELEQAVEKIFDKYDQDKDQMLSLDEIAALLRDSFKYNRDVTSKQAEEFVLVLTGQSGNKVEKHHFIRSYRKIYC